MQEYKKRLRILGERFGLKVEYDLRGGMTLKGERLAVSFSPTSKMAMTCTVATAGSTWTFDLLKQYAFDVVHRLCTGGPVDTYQPKGNPLTLQEYLEEEDAVDRFGAWKERLVEGIEENFELGGNHYNAQHYNGILIVYDLFTGAPANVYDVSELLLQR